MGRNPPDETRKEVAIHSKLNHKNIIKFVQVRVCVSVFLSTVVVSLA